MPARTFKLLSVVICCASLISGHAVAEGTAHGQTGGQVEEHAHGQQHGADHSLHDQPRELPVDALVHLHARAVPDSADGYNLHITTTNFRFAPENIDKPTEATEGHAHLYINGEKAMRLYGPWLHLPSGWLQTGTNTLRITLNDNQHRVWSQKGVPVAAEITINHGVFAGLEIRRTLTEPAETIRVPVGTHLRLTLAAADEVELHLHGYDLLTRASPDAPATFTFHAAHAGRFAIVRHDGDDLLGRDEAPVAYLEIVPE